jgi:hypothetical protein
MTTKNKGDTRVDGQSLSATTGSTASTVPESSQQFTLGLHRCKVCGTAWLLWPQAVHGGGWNLLDKYQRPGACCDNAAMGDQIEHLRDIPLSVASDERVRVLERAVGNCFMMAKREIARLWKHDGCESSLAQTLERWQHVQRFCENDRQREQHPSRPIAGRNDRRSQLMRLSYWLHDWRTRHLTAAEERVEAMKALPMLPEHERMTTKPQQPAIAPAKPQSIEEWKERYIA